MATSSADITPFKISIPETAVADLRDRLRRTRWPEPETTGDWTQGTPLSYVRELCRYWRDDYDWWAAEARLNRFPQFTTEIDKLRVHFVHVRSPQPGAVPLLMTHGWPSSVTEFHKVIDRLANPGKGVAFHVVCPSLPGFGFSGKPSQTGWGTGRIASAWDALMHRLGYPRYVAQGGDWGARIAMALGRQHPESLVGIHLNMVPFPEPGSAEDLTDAERAAIGSLARHRAQGSAYAAVQASRPQSIGYGLVDSPAALAGWVTEKFQAWSDCADDPGTVFTSDELLDNLMLYWLPATGASAARIYWESFAASSSNQVPVPVPVGCSVFPADIYRPSRRLAEPQFPDLRYWNELDRGGHFAALEQPVTFVEEVRAAIERFR